MRNALHSPVKLTVKSSKNYSQVCNILSNADIRDCLFFLFEKFTSMLQTTLIENPGSLIKCFAGAIKWQNVGLQNFRSTQTD